MFVHYLRFLFSFETVLDVNGECNRSLLILSHKWVIVTVSFHIV